MDFKQKRIFGKGKPGCIHRTIFLLEICREAHFLEFRDVLLVLKARLVIVIAEFVGNPIKALLLF